MTGTLFAANLPAEIEAKYQLALSDYRGGQCQRAEISIRDLMRAHHEIERFRSDYIAISVGCKKYSPVLKYINDDFLATAPTYVRDALLEAAIQSGNLGEAITAQRHIKQASPQLKILLVKRVYQTLSDKDFKSADRLCSQLASLYPDDVSAWDTRAYALREEGKLFEALETYQQMQAKFPENNSAPKAIAGLLMKLGMPQAADELIAKKHMAISAQEKFELEREIAIRELRWAATFDHKPQKRHEYVDRAIAALLAARQFALTNDLSDADVRGIDYDLVVAYEAGSQYQKAIKHYEQMVKEGDEPPPYVQLAVADSYSKARQHQKAEGMYRKALSADPGNTNATLGLYSSLIDQDKFEEAEPIIQGVSTSLKEQITAAQHRAYLPGEYRGFIEALRERYTSVRVSQANALAYRDKLEDANQAIRNILDEAPASDDALVAMGNMQTWMGNPQSASVYFRIVQNASPDNVDAQIGMADATFERRDYKASRAMLEDLQKRYPEKREVQELARKMSVYESPIITADFEVANGKCSSQSQNAATSDVRVYSSPIDDNYRIYARFRSLYSGPAVQSNVSGGTLGARYASVGHEISVEGGDRGYAKVEGTKYLNDKLSGSLSFERNAFYLFPGALYPTYSGDVVGGKVNWKNNDTQQALVGYQYWSLYNNNQTQAFGSFSQRLLTDYNYRIDGAVWVGNQQNSNPQVGYFAPSNQTEYSGTISFEVMQWRDLATKKYSFWHKIWGGYGLVTQQGFATLPMNTMGYGQNFTLGDRQCLAWGLGKTYFPFDGVRSGYLTGYLRFEKSF